MNISTEFLMKLHDQEIMDWLEDEYGEDAVTAFGECLPDPGKYTDEEMIAMCNVVLERFDSSLRIVSLEGKNDDGYYWRVKDDLTK